MRAILAGMVVHHVGSGVYLTNHSGLSIQICSNVLLINNIFPKKKGHSLVSAHNLRDSWPVVKIICSE